jgi:glycosyltransferase involved in cell wall biosynthesis
MEVTVRILAMVAAYPPAAGVGSWLMTHSLLRALVARGHEADVVLSIAEGPPYVLDGVRVWPHTGKSDPFRFLSDADVIVTHMGDAGRATTLGQMCGVPVIQICHNTGSQTASSLRRGGASLMVFNSRQMAAHFGDQHHGRSIIVHPPVDLAEYATTPGECITLINLSADKGADVFYRLAERFPDQRFLGVKGGYGKQVIEQAPNVEILDHVPADRMRDEVYARTRILLMPSAHESWGRTGIEAACSGIPVIAHPTEGLRESLGEAGTFADRGDLDTWETALKLLLDKRRWNGASRRAKKRAAELDPAADLERWCVAVEDLGRIPAKLRRQLPIPVPA